MGKFTVTSGTQDLKPYVITYSVQHSFSVQKFLNAISPTEDWGPADPEIKKQWAEEKKNFEKVPMKPLNGEII
jgi:hypothetical protein